MTEYTNDHVEEIEEQLPEGIQIDGIGDIPEGGDDVKVPRMENGEPYPSHIVPEDLGSDTGTEDDGSYEGDWDRDDYDDDDDEGEEEAAESNSPRDRFTEFASDSAALFGCLSSILSNESLQKLSFGVNSGDLGAFFSIELNRP